ncbi:MAG: hypothetical protein D6696_18695 [Acidobacteria bacterium]|nr:MAG: hypothetical protein D6696_18695 [Acidobacteriota bacterium]
MRGLHNDEPTLGDHLARGDLLRRVGEAVARCDPPQVFGVHGDWGSGKTSFLHRLHFYLTGDCPQQIEAERTRAENDPALTARRFRKQVTVVWFEAWRYQQERVPVVALLHEIRAQLPWHAKALAQTSKLAEVAIRGALLSLEDMTKRIGIQASKIEEAGRRWEEANLATALPSHVFRQHLEEALRKLLGKRDRRSRHRLVVLIDDLDRCEPETAYQLLEGIKIYLNLPSCVFVLGMNQRIIERAIAQHLPKAVTGEGEGAARVSRAIAGEYLEKLCQNIWHLPLVEAPGELLGRFLGLDFEGAEALGRVVDDYDCLPRNPRKIKGFANLLQRFADHWQGRRRKLMKEAEGARDWISSRLTGDATRRWNGGAAGAMSDEEVCDYLWACCVVIFAYLYQFQRPLYRILEGDSDFYREIERWCRGRPTASDRHFPFERRQSRVATDASEREPTPGAGAELRRHFHDPASAEILHVEPLVADLRLTDSEVRSYLLR